MNCMHTPMLHYQNALAYFALAVSYECIIFMKLTLGPNVIKHFIVVIY
jgi:hypothetical protein